MDRSPLLITLFFLVPFLVLVAVITVATLHELFHTEPVRGRPSPRHRGRGARRPSSPEARRARPRVYDQDAR